MMLVVQHETLGVHSFNGWHEKIVALILFDMTNPQHY